ncbi:thioredoxin family protein [Bacteroidota bacterium]
MKKIILFSVVLIFGVSLSCNSESNKNSSNNNLARNENSAATGTIKLTKQEFLDKVMNYEKNPNQWVYEGDLPCLIDFYADWCAPCRIAAPILEELAKEYSGKIHIYKIDTQKERELAAAFGIQGIPAFLYCPLEGNPQMTSGIAGTPEETKAMFKELIDNVLLNVN